MKKLINFGDFLKEVRARKGVSQTKLMEVTGVSRQTISNIENGYNECYLETANKLSEGLGYKILFVEK